MLVVGRMLAMLRTPVVAWVSLVAVALGVGFVLVVRLVLVSLCVVHPYSGHVCLLGG